MRWPISGVDSLVLGTPGECAHLRQGGYALWNASVEWTSPREHWELALRGENLGNRAHRTSGFAYPFGIVTGYYGRPRNWSLTLAYAF